MKIRKDYITNSSSASYTIRLLNKDLESYIDELKKDLWPPSIGAKEELEKIKKWHNDPGGLFERILKDGPEIDNEFESNIDLLLKISNRFYDLDCDDFDTGKIMLEYYINKDRIVIQQEGYDLLIKYKSTIHNNFISSIPDILKEIILKEVFKNEPKDIICTFSYD